MVRYGSLIKFTYIEFSYLLTEILGVEPAPNNGTMGSLHHLMNHPKPLPPPPTPEGMVENCPYPGSDEEYYDRIDKDMSDCICVLGVSTQFFMFFF